MIRMTKPARDKIDAIKANDRRSSHLNQGYLTPSGVYAELGDKVPDVIRATRITPIFSHTIKTAGT